MSNIYIQEPLTTGKVLLKTTVGDIEIELWTKEAPLASRNFIQLCMENYYNNTIFHRVVKHFIVQGGDPTGTGEGGESIYGHPFKDEFHTRLRFCRRGLVAMANAGKDDNGSQFFFTLAATQELQNKHTIFGKVAGDTLYNMLKLGEGLVDEEDRPLYPQKIISTEVLHNPFNDIDPRKILKSKEEKECKPKDKTAAVKNFKLLSFGEEAEEDEEETIAINKTFVNKGKSAHDAQLDPKLSSEPAVDLSKSPNEIDEEENHKLEIERKERTDRVKNKLLNKKITKESKKPGEDDEKEEDYYLGKSQHEENQKKLEEIKKEIRNFKRDVRNEKQFQELKEIDKQEQETRVSKEKKEYLESLAKYKEITSTLPKKGHSREEFAAKLCEQFKSRIACTKDKIMNESNETEEAEIDDDNSWMNHKMESEEVLPVLAKDASTKSDDWFEIYDPRNPINKRRRGEGTEKSKKFKN